MVSTRIRWARPAEARPLEDLQRRSSLVYEEYRASILAHPDAIESPIEDIRRRRVRVATSAGQLLGFSIVLPLSEDAVELDALFVEPEWMRQGIGHRLIADVVAIASKGGLGWIEVTANPRALGFYERTGFVAEGEVPTRFGPGLRMRLDLRR
jgi:GNAT superfamily N-acetyltransferase